MKDTIYIGARGSKLSIIQTEIVQNQLSSLLPHTRIAIKTITTKGDVNMKPIPLDSVGKGWFTKEIDKALLEGTIDLAVHSLKDLGESLADGLVIGAVVEREDAREALVSLKKYTLETLPPNARVGTDSMRRKATLLAKRPDLRVESVRGNVLTRLEKLDAGGYDALILGVAGLKRLKMEDRISEYFSLTNFIPSPGQGALAVVVKKTNKELLHVLKKLYHASTMAAVTAEREFSRVIGGGCKLPVGAYAECNYAKITLHGLIGTDDGVYILRDSETGKKDEAKEIGKRLAERMLEKSAKWYKSETSQKYIVVTRPQNESMQFKKQLEKLGYQVFVYPGISIHAPVLSIGQQESLKKYFTFDWIIFTSKNGVKYFMDCLHTLQIDPTKWKDTLVAAVGETTARALQKQGIRVDFVPSIFTTKQLGLEIKNIAGKKILLPRANIASQQLTNMLKDRGAEIVEIPIYETLITIANLQFEELIKKNRIRALTFTSPSIVKGVIEQLSSEDLKEKARLLPVFSIGPVTTNEAERWGFRTIYTAKVHTSRGLVSLIKETSV